MHKVKQPADGERFYSKHNKVIYDAACNCVRKTFDCETDFRTELNMYCKLLEASWVPIPKLLASDPVNRSLDLEFLGAETLLGNLEADEEADDVDSAVRRLDDLLNWLDKFNAVNGDRLVMHDVNFRNFAYHKGQLYGFDFEAVCQGDWFDEHCMVFAMYLLYDPIETDFKKEVCRRVMDKRDMGDLWPGIRSSMEVVYDRRKGLDNSEATG